MIGVLLVLGLPQRPRPTLPERGTDCLLVLKGVLDVSYNYFFNNYKVLNWMF